MVKPARSSAAIDDTLAAPSARATARREGFARTTVLPRVSAVVDACTDPGPSRRFEPLQLLGEGGVGEVSLVEDRDIERKVALKRLRPEMRSEPALARFAEEVRIIGQLEHPNITPVHDVGIDEEGQHYFVMKYVDGETLETIIGRLRAGDPVYVARFDHEQRIEIFLGILNAIRYAHAKGIIHRDLKPANIMVGPFGEVTVMDWGIAKRTRRDAAVPPSESLAATAAALATASDARARTQVGAVVGTPLYMAPEQAAGDHASVDERSDIYALSLLLYELLSLNHPLAELRTVEAVLACLVAEGVDERPWVIKVALARAGAPAEFADLIARGIARDRARRFASVDELEQALYDTRGGRIAVTCHVTLAKRAARGLVRWIDRSPMQFSIAFVVASMTLLAALVLVIMRLVH
jgi:serine/threonine-protein kinase